MKSRTTDTFFEFREQLCREQKSSACRIVIFGASGDLAKRKLFPSLAALENRGLLAPETRIPGCARSVFSDAAFKSRIREFLPSVSREAEGRFFDRIRYMALDYDSKTDYTHLRSCSKREFRELRCFSI